MGFNIRNEANLIIHHGNHLLARTFCAEPYCPEEAGEEDCRNCEKEGCYSCQKEEQQKACVQKNIQISCVNQSRTQGGNL